MPLVTLSVLALLFFTAGCNTRIATTANAASEAPEIPSLEKAEIRISGLVQAVHSMKITVPQIQGQFGNLTLTNIVANGVRVKEGDVVATFDPATQIDAARDARAKFEDLGHQVNQKIAENRAEAERRAVELRQAETDQKKAELELEKGPVLSDIDRLQSEARAEGARSRVANLKLVMGFRDKAEAAALRGIELQRDRQKILIERAEANLKKLEIRAPLPGMVVHELLPRSGSLGRAQVGDQIYRGYPLASIFDPKEMIIKCSINEPDVTALIANRVVSVHFDAYPELTLRAHFISASPVASSGMGTPLKTFVAIFGLDQTDPHLLPDLSAAVVLTPRTAANTTPASN